MRKAIAAPAGNIAIIKAESAREWILASDHVISSHSTTLIEAAIAGKPVHLFSPEPFPGALKAEWHDLIPLLDNRAAFLQAVRQSPIEPTGAQLAAWARARQFPENDPLDAIVKRIVQLWASTDPHGPSSLPDHRRLWNGRSLVEVLHNWWHRFRSHEDIFGAHDVARRVSRWQRVLEASCAAHKHDFSMTLVQPIIVSAPTRSTLPTSTPYKLRNFDAPSLEFLSRTETIVDRFSARYRSIRWRFLIMLRVVSNAKRNSAVI